MWTRVTSRWEPPARFRLATDQGMLDPVFFVVYGDSYLPIRLVSVLADYQRRNVPVLMTVYRDPGRLECPNVVFEDSMVKRYEKGLPNPPPEMCYVDYGLSVWRREVIQTIVPSGETVDLAVPFAILSNAGQLAGYEADQRFYEVGSPDGLRDLEAHLQSGSDLADAGQADSGTVGMAD